MANSNSNSNAVTLVSALQSAGYRNTVGAPLTWRATTGGRFAPAVYLNSPQLGQWAGYAPTPYYTPARVVGTTAAQLVAWLAGAQ